MEWIKPSKDSVRSIHATIKAVVRRHRASTPDRLINHLNPIIRGWCNYHRHVCASKSFSALDHHVWYTIWKWAKRRHPRKMAHWIKNKYFASGASNKWIFFGKDKKGNVHRLIKASSICILHYWPIKGAANPYDTDWDHYFASRKYRSVARVPLSSVDSLSPARLPGASLRAIMKA